jgi:outer membrane immunogenic protein
MAFMWGSAIPDAPPGEAIKMKMFFGVLAVLGTFTVAASAADLEPQRPNTVPVWTGFYIGGHGGWASGRWDGTLTYADAYLYGDPWKDVANQRISANGWEAGGQAGVNYQTGAIVWGVEVDASATGLKKSGSFDAVGLSAGYNWTIENKLDWYGTARGRIGVAFDRLLIYGTGGVAFGQSSSTEIVTADKRQGFDPAQVTARASVREHHVGWAAGAGAEWMLLPNWTFKVEWLYVDLGDADYRFLGTAYPDKPACTGAVSSACSFKHMTDSFPAGLQFQTIRAGINLKF